MKFTKKIKEFADTDLALVIIVVGLISIFVPDPLPFVEEVAAVILAIMRMKE